MRLYEFSELDEVFLLGSGDEWDETAVSKSMWQNKTKVSDYKGYEIFYGKDGPFLSVFAANPEAKTANDPIGTLDLELSDSGNYKVISIVINPKHRKLGLSKILYDTALKNLNLTLESDDKQTPGGRALWTWLANRPDIKVWAKLDPEDSSSPESKVWVERGQMKADFDLYGNPQKQTELQRKLNQRLNYIKQAIAKGKFTQEQGEKILSKMETKYNEMIDNNVKAMGAILYAKKK